LRNRNRNSSSIDLSIPFIFSFCNVPSNILFAMPASLNDSSKFSKEYAQIERFNKTLDASIGSIGYEDDEPLLSASARLSDANKSCSKYAFAFVYDSNASKWFEVCGYIYFFGERRENAFVVSDGDRAL
jgi:hypothetical protein